MGLRRFNPLRAVRRLRSRARRCTRLLCRVAVLVWFTIGSFGIPLVQASPRDADRDADEGSQAASAIDPHVLASLGIAEEDPAVLEDELCVLPDLLVPPKPPGHCGCSLGLQAAGRCCCAPMKTPTAKSCCANRASPAADDNPQAIRANQGDDQQDGPTERFVCLTCPCGSGSDAWIAVAAEPRILGDAVALAPGGPPVERLVATAPRLPQIFLSPEAPPPRAMD